MNLRFRPGTGDARLWRAVYDNNEYRVRDLSGKVVVDIGANIGAFACLASSKGASRVIAIEPCQSNFDVLRHNCGELDGITVLKLAISNRDGESLSLCTEEEYSQYFRERMPAFDFVEMAGVHVDCCEGVNGSDECESITLETLLRSQDVALVDLLKVDCEGGEWKLFADGEAALFDRISEIVGEYHLAPETLRAILGEGVDGVEWLRRRLEDWGYEVSFRGNANNPNVGWFHASKPALDRVSIERAGWARTTE